MNDFVDDRRGAVAVEPAATLDDGKPALGRPENVPRGILMMIVATFLFASASAASKWLVDIYPIGETMFMRSLSSLITAAAIILPVSGLSVYATKRPRDHILRGMSQTISQLCLLVAFSLMPLAGRHRDQFCGAAVCCVGLDLLARRARRLGAWQRLADRFCRRS